MKSNKNITSITPQDYPLFQELFDKEERHTYGNSWTYVTQCLYGMGEFKLGYKYFDGKNLFAMGMYPRIENPSEYAFYFVRPIGPEILNAVINTANSIRSQFPNPIFIKKIFKDQSDFLLGQGFISSEKYPWHSKSHAEDDTYPEMIYDCNETINYLNNAKRKENIRKSYKKALNLDSRFDMQYTTVDFKEKAWRITEEFFNNRLKNPLKINLSSKYDYFNPIYMDNERQRKEILVIDGEPMAYYIKEKQTSLYTSLYVLISNKSKIDYISDYVVFNLINNNETKYLNIGGSEDLGIHNFKIKYKPHIENKMYWVVMI